MGIKEETDCALSELACMDLTQPEASCNSLSGSSYREMNVLRLSKMKSIEPVSVGGSSGSVVSHTDGRATGSEDCESLRSSDVRVLPWDYLTLVACSGNFYQSVTILLGGEPAQDTDLGISVN